MGSVEVLVPLGTFAMVVAIVWVVQAHGAKNRSTFYETVRAAIERGADLTPDTVRALGAPKRSRHADIKWGIIWMALAAACVVFGWTVGGLEPDEDVFHVFMGIAAFPGFVGLALLLYGVLTFKSQE